MGKLEETPRKLREWSWRRGLNPRPSDYKSESGDMPIVPVQSSQGLTVGVQCMEWHSVSVSRGKTLPRSD